MVLLGKEDNFKDRIWKVLSKRRSKLPLASATSSQSVGLL